MVIELDYIDFPYDQWTTVELHDDIVKHVILHNAVDGQCMMAFLHNHDDPFT